MNSSRTYKGVRPVTFNLGKQNMNFIYQTVKKIITIFGFTTLVITLTISLIYDISLLRDDPYIIGFFFINIFSTWMDFVYYF